MPSVGRRNRLGIPEFAKDMIDELSHGSLDASVKTEQALERDFVIPIAKRVLSRHPDVLLFTHPFRGTQRCSPECADAPLAPPGGIIGCPACWAKTKAWASVAAFGTHHTFDLVAKDTVRTLAIELKLVGARGGRMPNAEIQRFLGQCSLAATKHDIVIGLCACRGLLSQKWREDTDIATRWFAEHDVHLLFPPIA